MVTRILPLLLTLAACGPKAIEPSMIPAEVVPYQTIDGWEMAVRHYPGDGPTVLLVHGMSVNHYNWDYHPDVSLAAYLQEAGWDVWVPELRGDQGTTPPDRVARNSYTFDDHALYDLPAVVERVKAETGSDKLYWIGHSMGGMLLYSYLTQYPDDIEAGVTLCSPSVFENPIPIHQTVQGLGWLFPGRGRIPNATLGKALSGLGRRNLVTRQLADPDYLDAGMVRGMARNVLIDMPRPMIRQALGWVHDQSFVNDAGVRWVQGHPDVPLLVIGAKKDGVVSERDVRATCERYPDCRYVQLSVEQGFSHDYGHVDPVIGTTSREEVFPIVLEFLEARRDEGLAAIEE